MRSRIYVPTKSFVFDRNCCHNQQRRYWNRKGSLHALQQPHTASITGNRYYHELSYNSHGKDPIQVLNYRRHDETIQDYRHPSSNNNNSSSLMIKIEMLHAPWNPADMNTVQGRYPYPSGFEKPKKYSQSCVFEEQTVAGSEGWGRVVDYASSTPESSRPEIGSLVAFGRIPGLGTFRSSMWVPESYVTPVPNGFLNILGPSGCTLWQLGGTAYNMLHLFERLHPGDVIIQNCGNSAVGFMVSQFAARTMGVKVVSFVRRGNKTEEEFNNLVQFLMTEGNNSLVISEEDALEDLQTKIPELKSQIQDLSESYHRLPKLALNAVGGDSANKLLLKLLGNEGTMVTYGGMSGKGIEIATPQLIFKNLSAQGYWHSRWMLQQQQRNCEEGKDDKMQIMFDALMDGVSSRGVKCPPVKVFSLPDYREAMEWHANQKDGIHEKLVFDCREEI